MIDQKNTDLVEIGILSKPHGLRGEIKLNLHSPDSNLIINIKEVYIDSIVFKVNTVKKIPNGALIKFLSKDDRTSVEKLVKKRVFVDKQIIPTLPNGNYYFFELIGSNVVYNDEIIGTLIEIVETKANNIYVVKKKDGEEVLIPKTKSFIKNFNKEKKILEVILPEVI